MTTIIISSRRRAASINRHQCHDPHTNYPGSISIAEDVYQSKGFDSAWDTDYPFSVTPVLAQTTDAIRDMTVISNAVQHNVRYDGTATQTPRAVSRIPRCRRRFEQRQPPRDGD